MPKYLLQASYTTDGAKGLQKDGGTKRQNAAKVLIESLGGKLESFYFAFGDRDVFAVADLPDAASAAAASVALGASGAVRGTTTVLITAAEMDQAVKKSASYTPPGR
jgi:uncharacterized protein with GYD domain